MGLGRVFLLHDAAAGELEGEGVAADQVGLRQGNGGAGKTAGQAGAGRSGQRSNIDAVQDDFERGRLPVERSVGGVEQAQRGLPGVHGVREREVERVIGMGSAHLNGMGEAQIAETQHLQHGGVCQRLRVGLAERLSCPGDGRPGRNGRRGLGCAQRLAAQARQAGQQQQSGGFCRGLGGGGLGRHQAAENLVNAVDREADDAAEADQRLIDLAVGEWADPGVGAGVKGAGQGLLLGDGGDGEGKPYLASIDAHDAGADLRVASLLREGEAEALAPRELGGLGDLHRCAADGHVRGDAAEFASIGQVEAHRDARLDAHRLPPLPLLVGHGGRHAQDHHVEENPDEVHDHRAPVLAAHEGQPIGARHQAQEVEKQHPLGGSGDLAVELRLGQGVALVGDIELAQLGIDEGKEGGGQDVRGKNGLVNLIPEGVPVSALDPGVGHARQNEVREGIDQNGYPVAWNDGAPEQQVGQGRAQKDEARHRIQKVGHGVEVAQPLRKPELTAEQGIVGAQDLDHAAGPANALADVG